MPVGTVSVGGAVSVVGVAVVGGVSEAVSVPNHMSPDQQYK